jgi:hypothetical protein
VKNPYLGALVSCDRDVVRIRFLEVGYFSEESFEMMFGALEFSPASIQ